MNDFEDRLTSALRSAGDDAPDAAGLAPAARGRARARRRRTALTSVAAVVAVVGVVGGVALLSGGDAGTNRLPVAADSSATDGDTPTSSPPATRLESWRDLSVQVPTSWGYGNLSTYCIEGGQPVVERPGGVVRTVGCRPWNNGYGLQFLDGSAMHLVYSPGHIWQYEKGDVEVYPNGSWLGYQRGSGDNLVWVVAKDRETVEAILGSFVANADVDPNGCATHGGAGPTPAEGTVRVCRYNLDGWLEQSEVLTGTDATDALAAWEAAPVRDPDRMCTMEISGPTVQITSPDAEGSLNLNVCQGFTWDGAAHELTADAIYWALSPGWSGGVAGNVPMPTKLRQ